MEKLVYFSFLPPERLAGKRELLCWQGFNRDKKPLLQDKNFHMSTMEQDEGSQQFFICAGIYTAAFYS